MDKSNNKEKKTSGVRSTQTAKKASTAKVGDKSVRQDTSSMSETSFDTNQIPEELESIKKQINDLPSKKDLELLGKLLVGKNEIQSLVTEIVQKLLTSFEDKVRKEMRSFKEEYDNKIQAVTIENENLIKEIKFLKDTNIKLKKDISINRHYTQEAIKSANFNEQYSRKNNIKVFNFPTKTNQDYAKIG